MAVLRAPLFPRPTPRDLAAWWLWLAEVRKRVAVSYPRLSMKAHQRHIVAEAEGHEWMELYRPLSEQRWELLRLKASERAESCATCNGRGRSRISRKELEKLLAAATNAGMEATVIPGATKIEFTNGRASFPAKYLQCPTCKGTGARQETKACPKGPDGFHDFEWNDVSTCIHCGFCPDDDRRTNVPNSAFLTLVVEAP